MLNKVFKMTSVLDHNVQKCHVAWSVHQCTITHTPRLQKKKIKIRRGGRNIFL